MINTLFGKKTFSLAKIASESINKSVNIIKKIGGKTSKLNKNKYIKKLIFE